MIEPATPLRPTDDPGLKAVRTFTEMFYRGDLAALYARFSDEMKKSFSREQLDAMRKRVQDSYGKEAKVLGEDSQTKGDFRRFVRWARFDRYEGVIEVEWILRKSGSIAGFFVRPARPSEKKVQKAP